jgi:hypothetical protein
MITFPREGRYFISLMLSLGFFFLGIYGGMDAWQDNVRKVAHIFWVI